MIRGLGFRFSHAIGSRFIPAIGSRFIPAFGSRFIPAIGILLASLWVATAGADTLRFESDSDEPRALVIYGVLDPPQMRPLLEDFHQRNPDVSVVYHNLQSIELHARILQERDTPGADVVMSPAMPWQYQLANEGLSRALNTPAANAWPSWARWRNELFGVTFEPIVMVYRRDLAERMAVPQSHAELLERLTRDSNPLRERVVTYDPRLSGAGYTYAIEDARISARYWDLVEALGRSNAALETTTSAMLQGLSDGRYWLGYNLIGSYVQDYVKSHPELAMVVPRDYALVLQRLVMILHNAPHPKTAARFVDYLLDESTQRLLAERTPLGAVHPALEGEGTASALRARLGDAIRPVRIGPGLLATLDTLKRQTLLEQWQQAFENRSTFSEGPLADQAPLPNDQTENEPPENEPTEKVDREEERASPQETPSP